MDGFHGDEISLKLNQYKHVVTMIVRLTSSFLFYAFALCDYPLSFSGDGTDLPLLVELVEAILVTEMRYKSQYQILLTNYCCWKMQCHAPSKMPSI